MATKIKIFKYSDTDMLEAKVNDFCKWCRGVVLNIQYSVIYTGVAWYSCCITYTENNISAEDQSEKATDSDDVPWYE